MTRSDPWAGMTDVEVGALIEVRLAEVRADARRDLAEARRRLARSPWSEVARRACVEAAQEAAMLGVRP